MAKVELLVPFLLKWEGGFVNDPQDLGGATNKGITIGTYTDYCRKKGLPKPTVTELKKITEVQWTEILKIMYWDKWLADNIKNQSLANLLVDWVWSSGIHAIKIPQKALGVKVDGIVGAKTIAAINDYPVQKVLFLLLQAERAEYINRICISRPANLKYKKGWLNRINALKFEE